MTNRRYGSSPYAAVRDFDRDSWDMFTRRFAFVLIVVSCMNGLFFIQILPVGTEVCLAPCHHGLQDGNEALAEFSKRIFHFGRDFLINLPVEETVTFQFPELLCERGLRDAVKAAVMILK